MEMSIHKGANFYLFSLIHSIFCIFTTTGKAYFFNSSNFVNGDCGGHPLVNQAVTLSFTAKVDLADLDDDIQ